MKSVPRLLLQPLIENCYMHSLTKAQTLVIHLIARKKNGCLQVFVVDNGNGIAPGKLTELNEALQSGSKNIRSGASGLCNVNSRLVLRYGERFRLRIFSKEGHGTAIQILIPFDRK